MKRLLSLTIVVFAMTASAAYACNAPAAADSLVQSLHAEAPGLRTDVLKLALNAEQCAAAQGLVKRSDLLTVIDYSLPSSTPRLFVFNIAQHKLLFRELVAHGKNSGDNIANFFSNSPSSLATSIGLFVTADTYFGHNGYSLRLKGLDEGFNDMAMDRAIVMHGASYVSQEAVKVLGRLGRSWGCPAVSSTVSQKIIDTIRGGSAIFSYYPDKQWLSKSAFLR
jgi:hypothetical protein